MKILVICGTGNVGSKVISELLRRGASVRALVRKQQAAKVANGVERFLGDLLDPVSVNKHFRGSTNCTC